MMILKKLHKPMQLFKEVINSKTLVTLIRNPHRWFQQIKALNVNQNKAKLQKEWCHTNKHLLLFST